MKALVPCFVLSLLLGLAGCQSAPEPKPELVKPVEPVMEPEPEGWVAPETRAEEIKEAPSWTGGQ